MSPAELITKFEKTPVHVAIIMDGNGRWAEGRGLPRVAGHQAGTENLRRVIRACVEFGIPYLTLYAFSTENWDRPKDEVEGLMNILEDVIDREMDEMQKEGVQFHHIGHLEALNPTLQEKVRSAIVKTNSNNRLVLTLAFNYGGRDEIICAISRMIRDGVNPNEVTAEMVSKYLFTAGLPDPDLIIRTSGEMRISNFLIWQGVYAEWYFTKTLWPDFNRDELFKAVIEFGQRDRRFGRIATTETEDLGECS
jgi:undecaprenyl diphosphate synthase